ncbi:MAG: hypothetical protein PHO08_10720 [Methylococcales bacterium]|nr:hypothetical protein [Methylococcales bacterium]
MNQYAMLDAVQRSLKYGAITLDQVWSDHAQVWQLLGWNQSQVKLWLGCLPTIQVRAGSNSEQTYHLEATANTGETTLADEIVALLEKAGRPMPLLQCLGKLPAGRVVTEPMLRLAAMEDARLELKGPLVKLA